MGKDILSKTPQMADKYVYVMTKIKYLKPKDEAVAILKAFDKDEFTPWFDKNKFAGDAMITGYSTYNDTDFISHECYKDGAAADAFYGAMFADQEFLAKLMAIGASGACEQ